MQSPRDARHDALKVVGIEKLLGGNEPFQIDTRANGPQTTPRKFAFLTSVALGFFGARWEQLPG
jgi:hypothetical protein